MTPWYKSRRIWTAILTLVGNVLAIVLGDIYGQPDLAETVVAAVTTLGAALLVALGLGDTGKEAAAIKAASGKSEG
ncbi:MAG TPA: hypothetical protein ENK57_06465 [Polyangiaceae bacterium]|nr:hypothetical protein [Polyangiaceae bacterium]